MAKSKTPDLDVNALLEGAAKASKGKGKDDVPVIEVSDPGVQAKMRIWAESKKAVDLADAKKKAMEAELADFARPHHEAVVLRDRKVGASIKLNSGSDIITIAINKNQWSKIDSNNVDRLKEIFGEDYNDCFVPKTEIELTPEALTDTEILKKLILAVGADKFTTYFKVTKTVVPTQRAYEGQYLDPDIKAKMDLAKNEDLVKQYAPAFGNK